MGSPSDVVQFHLSPPPEPFDECSLLTGADCSQDGLHAVVMFGGGECSRGEVRTVIAVDDRASDGGACERPSKFWSTRARCQIS